MRFDTLESALNYIFEPLEKEAESRAARQAAGNQIAEVLAPASTAPKTLVPGQTSVNAAGGKQSHVEEAMDEIPAEVLLTVARILGQGVQKYGRGNWRLLRMREDQVNHAARHIYEWLSGDRSEDHLCNAICRLMFAKAQELEKEAERAKAAKLEG